MKLLIHLHNIILEFILGGSDNNASIQNVMKNIISIELINVNIPIDPIIQPFDSRIYLDVKQYPYLLLDLEELNGIFSGTNSAINGSFSQLIFDKQHIIEVINSDIINNRNEDNDADDKIHSRFANKFKKGFYRYIPSFFEKKQFYNQPLSVLKQLTVKLKNPDGDLVNNQADVLGINAMATVSLTGGAGNGNDTIDDDGATDLEINITRGFPNVDSNDKFLIRITTTFSNKQFKIGDTILIKNVPTTII